MLLVTGGAGFIGSNFIYHVLHTHADPVLNLDKLTYAGNLQNLASLKDNPLHLLVQGDIADRALVRDLLRRHRPSGIVNFAAETHVDRSIKDPEPFVHTNIQGTAALLAEGLAYWSELPLREKQQFRFLHISTDEVFGSLDYQDSIFTEGSHYAPNSPYAASKAASDHLCRAYWHTYQFPVIVTHCSNNFGPYQSPEKLIPLVIYNALEGKNIPIYGNGLQERNWLFVKDHCTALSLALKRGTSGECFNIGAEKSRPNIEVVTTVCQTLDDLYPRRDGLSYRSLLTHVADRPGHDIRYDIDSKKIREALGWQAATPFAQGIRETVSWYLNNKKWLAEATSGAYQQWIQTHYHGARQ